MNHSENRLYWKDDHQGGGPSHDEFKRPGGGGKRKECQRGPQTYRRGRAIEFLERMHVKRETLKQQLDAQEYQSIRPIVLGELKAIDMVINEFMQLFDLQNKEEAEASAPAESGASAGSEGPNDLRGENPFN
ncbi:MULTISPECIES: hypothetical protein [Paenibacillus]|uniref:hypothetical protein n=1 Tax=Paenibacillus TaxID=44249 RepID=UPI001595C0F5|nr:MULTISPECIES: hypothetical protein [Paenibacillus]